MVQELKWTMGNSMLVFLLLTLGSNSTFNFMSTVQQWNALTVFIYISWCWVLSLVSGLCLPLVSLIFVCASLCLISICMPWSTCAYWSSVNIHRGLRIKYLHMLTSLFLLSCLSFASSLSSSTFYKFISDLSM